MKDWKTTTAGILTIIAAMCAGGIALIKGQNSAAIAALTTGIPAGLGLIKAADSASAQK